VSGASITPGPVLAAVLLVLVVVAAVVVGRGGLGSGRAVLLAGLRAAVQLAAVSLLIVAVLRSGWFTAGFVLLMFTVATVTSARRIGAAGRVPTRRTGWVAVPLAAGAVPVLGLLLASGVVPLRPIAVVPIAGIIIGNAMTATSQAARRALDDLRDRHGEYEAALALGFQERPAALEICRPAAGQALIPPLDQTRTVGLVTLPGAFVGLLLGGASPVQAGVTQLLVLIGLLAAESLAVLVVVQLVAAGRVRRTADR
jgi:putative ABC transport system permease protein